MANLLQTLVHMVFLSHLTMSSSFNLINIEFCITWGRVPKELFLFPAGRQSGVYDQQMSICEHAAVPGKVSRSY